MKNRWIFVLFLLQILMQAGYAANDASMMSQSVSSSMYAGRSYPILLAMRNTGTTTWTAASGYRLGSQNPQDNMNWGLNRVNLSASDSIAPGSFKMFSFTVITPSTPGTYNFQWKMIQGSSGWFGDPSTNVVITVMANPVSTTSTTTITTTSSTSTTTTRQTTTTVSSTTTTSQTTTTTTTTSSTTTTQPTCSSSPGQNLVAGDNAIDFQTPHEYPSNMTCSSGTYTCPAGYRAKVYARYDTETWYDYFFISDAVSGNGTPYSGNSSGFVWLTPPVPVNALMFGFSSDLSTTRWGIDVDTINCYFETTTTTTSTLYPTTSTTSSTSTTTTIPQCPASPDSYLTPGINPIFYKTPRSYMGVIDCYSGVYTCPPDHSAKVHAKYDINSGHDFFYAIDPASLNQTAYSGNSSDYLWLEQGYRTIRFRFTSDGSASQWGVDIDVLECIENPMTTTSTTTSSTTSSIPGQCIMNGNEQPCDEVTLTEIVDSINQWAQGSFVLGDIVDLINSWADPASYPAV